MSVYGPAKWTLFEFESGARAWYHDGEDHPSPFVATPIDSFVGYGTEDETGDWVVADTKEELCPTKTT